MELSGEEREMINPSIFRVETGPSHDNPDALGASGADPGSHFSKAAPPPPPSAKAVSSVAPPRYLECLRNHAASAGGNILDGCREFMGSGDDAFKCAACNCHRNFHRKSSEVGGGGGCESRFQLLPPPPLPSRVVLHHQQQTIPPNYPFATAAAQPMAVAFGGAESSSEDVNATVAPCGPAAYASTAGRKRFRTKFTAEQKGRMMEFAGRMGWRIQSRNEAEIQKFCAEVGVRRQVFKVWMHNNKNSATQHKQQQQQQQHQHHPHEPL